MGANLLDNDFEAESRVEKKNKFIRKANSQINGIDAPIWNAFEQNPIDYAEVGRNFEDKTFSFDQNVLRSSNLHPMKIRDLESPIIYHEDTMAEGMIFSDRNVTAVSAALACLIHYDNRQKSRLIKMLIHPHNRVS